MTRELLCCEEQGGPGLPGVKKSGCESALLPAHSLAGCVTLGGQTPSLPCFPQKGFLCK